jgi:hemerythrin-like domain-containing protein
MRHAHNGAGKAASGAIMLSAESAWRVLHAEHASMRELVDAMDAARRSGGWRCPGPGVEALRAPLRRLQTFDDATHRPKGVVLMATLRGRSTQADALLEEIQRDQGRCDRLLARALELLDAVEGGDAAAADALPAVLDEHRATLLHHLEREDTLLHSHTARLLTAAEWSKVVSSISSVVQSAAGRAGAGGADRVAARPEGRAGGRRGSLSPLARSRARRHDEA